MIRCIATAPGYDNVKIREPGEEFELPDGSKQGTWFTIVKPAKAQKAVASGDSTQVETKTPGADVA